jgi:hypothetical protein
MWLNLMKSKIKLKIKAKMIFAKLVFQQHYFCSQIYKNCYSKD